MPRFVVLARDPLIIAEGVAARLPENVPCQRGYGADLDLDAIFNQLGGGDLFNTRRAFHYSQFLELKLGPREGRRLGEILERLPAEVTLVCSQLLTFERRGDEKKKLSQAAYKCWSDGATVDDLRGLSEGPRAVQWLRRRARERYGLVLEQRQVEHMLAMSGDQLALADTELEKLALLKRDARPQRIPDELVQATLSHSPAARFYELADAVLTGSPRVQRLLVEWFSAEPKAYRLIGELGRRFLGLKALAEGKPVQPPFLARQLRSVARRWPAPRLAGAIRQLARVEHELKSGRIPGESSRDAELSALQLLVAGLSAPPEPRARQH